MVSEYVKGALCPSNATQTEFIRTRNNVSITLLYISETHDGDLGNEVICFDIHVHVE